MPQVIDSYTGDPYVEDYISPIEGIRRGRESFWRRAELARASTQYWVSPLPSDPASVDSPAAPDPTESHLRTSRPSGWQLRRLNSPSDLFPVFPDQKTAVRVMDWCVSNDASVQIAVHWLEKSNPVPFLCMLQDIVRLVTND